MSVTGAVQWSQGSPLLSITIKQSPFSFSTPSKRSGLACGGDPWRRRQRRMKDDGAGRISDPAACVRPGAKEV